VKKTLEDCATDELDGSQGGAAQKTTLHRCVGCGASSPQTETNYTLISSRHGWRLSLRTTPDGKRHSEWRCPSCWSAFRAKR
jgi:hypothetical protein